MGGIVGYQPITDDEYQAALQKGAERLGQCVRASAVAYDAVHDRVMIQFAGMVIGLDREFITEFADYSPEQISTIHLSALGDAIGIDDAFVQVDIAGLLKDCLTADAINGMPMRRSMASA